MNNINAQKEFMLAEIPSDADNVCIKGVNVDENSINDDSNPQSKVKESKVNKSIVKEIKINKIKIKNIKINNRKRKNSFRVVQARIG